MTDWRSRLAVLVPDAQALGSIGVIRSLGRAGYPVIAMSSLTSALGLKSSFVRRGLVSPPYSSPAFIGWLVDAIEGNGIRAIVPSEGFLHAVRSRFAEFAHLMPISTDPETVYPLLSKRALFLRLVESGKVENLPRTVFVDAEMDDATAKRLRDLGYPQYLKLDHLDATNGADNAVVRLPDPGTGMRVIGDRLRHYRAGLVQEECRGVGVGAFILRWNGEELATFMHRRLHEVPHTGGASSYRRSWHHDGILADARRRAAELDYQGVGMFEYKWEPSHDRFWLLELNARFWGSLHLAIFAGVDFPKLLLDAFFGRPTVQAGNIREIRCRQTFPAEVAYVLSCIRDPDVPAFRKLAVMGEFFRLGLDSRVYSDYWFPGDRTLYFRSIWQTAMKYLAPRSGRAVRNARRSSGRGRLDQQPPG